jgi:transcriptional regulator with XRE-family HTH domain
MNTTTLLGEKIKVAREAANLSVEDLSRSATISKKQLQQIEEGGDSSFYSVAIKLIAAKKVAKILKMHDSDFL